jgi:potassium efflux system protein
LQGEFTTDSLAAVPDFESYRKLEERLFKELREKVINWTHSDQLKRIELPVGIRYSTPLQSLITLLVLVALRNPHILRDPAPKGLVTGFGDSAINFALRAWTDRFDDRRRIKNDLASTIYDAVLAAGMTFPFAQRVIRLLNAAGRGDAPAADLLGEERNSV